LILVVLVGIGVAIWYFLVPKTILYDSGNGEQASPIVNSKHFNTHGNWSVTYTYTPTSDDDGQCNFGYIVINSNGYAGKNESVVVLGAGGTHTMHYNDSDRHYLEVAPTCPWSVVVKDRAIL